MTTRKKWDSLPSSYVRVVLNDELVFSSRVKPVRCDSVVDLVGRACGLTLQLPESFRRRPTSTPPPKSSAETGQLPASTLPSWTTEIEVSFCCWARAITKLTSRGHPRADHDVLIGFVSLALGDLLSERSQVTKCDDPGHAFVSE